MASFVGFPSTVGSNSLFSSYVNDIKCGFCLKENDDLVEAKLLPCDHIYCLSCLIGAREVKEVIECPTCGKIYTGNPATLPLAEVGKRKPVNPCNVCKEKEQDEVPAVSYCATCKKMFCTKHQKYHDELMSDHDTQDLTHIAKDKNSERTCSQHNLPLSMGCNKCKAMLCVECIDDIDTCSGSKHSPVSLRKLYSNLRPKIEDMKKQISSRKDQILKLLKKTESVLCQQDDETEAMLQQLYTFREKEMRQVKDKFTDLERQLQEGRGTNREKLKEFKEQKLETDLNNLGNKLMVIETSLAEANEIDAVSAFKEAESLLIENELPQLCLTEFRELQVQDERPVVIKVEVMIIIANVANDDGDADSLSSSQGSGTPPPSPSNVSGVERLTPKSAICTVCNKSSKKIFKLSCAHIVCSTCLIRLPGMLGRAMARCPICKPRKR